MNAAIMRSGFNRSWVWSWSWAGSGLGARLVSESRSRSGAGTIVKEHLNNDIGCIIAYTGKKKVKFGSGRRSWSTSRAGAR